MRNVALARRVVVGWGGGPATPASEYNRVTATSEVAVRYGDNGKTRTAVV